MDGSQPPTTKDSGSRRGFIPKPTPPHPQVRSSPHPPRAPSSLPNGKAMISPHGSPPVQHFPRSTTPSSLSLLFPSLGEHGGHASSMPSFTGNLPVLPGSSRDRDRERNWSKLEADPWGAGGCGVLPGLFPAGTGDSPLGRSRLSARFPGAASGFPPAAASFPVGAAPQHSLRAPSPGIKPKPANAQPSVKSVIPAAFPPRLRLELTQGVYSESVTWGM